MGGARATHIAFRFPLFGSPMADRVGRRRSPQRKATRSHENDRSDEVCRKQASVDSPPDDEKQIRETLAEYFAILREWDLKLRQNDAESEFT